jgi:hypothetical protein
MDAGHAGHLASEEEYAQAAEYVGRLPERKHRLVGIDPPCP